MLWEIGVDEREREEEIERESEKRKKGVKRLACFSLCAAKKFLQEQGVLRFFFQVNP